MSVRLLQISDRRTVGADRPSARTLARSARTASVASDATAQHFTVRDRHEISHVRRRVRDASIRLSTDEEWLDAIVLAVSEVVTNAIEYGSGGPVDITTRIGDGAVVVEVGAEASGIPLPPTGPVPATEVRGRGLQVVHALADHVAIDVRGGRVTVTCGFDTPD